MKTYLVDGNPVEVDDKDVSAFIKNFPNAKEAVSFIVDNDTVDVDINDLESFKKSYPNAKELYPSSEKKNLVGKGIQPDLQGGGEVGASDVQSTESEGFKPKRIGETQIEGEAVDIFQYPKTEVTESPFTDELKATLKRLPTEALVAANEIKKLKRKPTPQELQGIQDKYGITKPEEVDALTKYLEFGLKGEKTIEPSAIDYISNAWQRGTNNARLSSYINMGRMPSEEELKTIAEINRFELPASKITEKFNNAPDFDSGVKELAIADASDFGLWLAENVVQSLGALYKGAPKVAERALQSGAVGAGVGTAIPAIGTAAGGMTGAGYGYIVGMGEQSANLEYANTFIQSLKDSGVDITDEASLKKALNNENLIKEAKKKAMLRGVPVGFFDGLSAGIGGKIVTQPGKSAFGKMAKALAEPVVQAGLGGAGAAAGQLASEGKITDGKEIFTEIVAEFGTSPVEILTGSLRNNKLKAEKKPYSVSKNKTELFKIFKGATKEEIDFELARLVALGKITEDQKQMMSNLIMSMNEADKVTPQGIPNRDEAVVIISEKKELEKEAENVDTSFQPIVQDQITQLSNNLLDLVSGTTTTPTVSEPVQPITTTAQEQGVEETVSESVSEVGDGTAKATTTVLYPLKDVESTQQALYNLYSIKDFEEANQIVSDLFYLIKKKDRDKIETNLSRLKISFDSQRIVAKAYHKAKADGSNPELVKAVEELLTPKIEQDAKEQQSGQMREQGVQDQPQRKGDSDMPIVNEAELQDRKAVEEEITQEEIDLQQEKETQYLLNGEAQKRRSAGKFIKDGIEYVRNKVNKGIRGNKGVVKFAEGVPDMPFTYKLVEAEELQPSHSQGYRNPMHFIPEAQPKNRNDEGSKSAEMGFANEPRFKELGENTNAYSGAPVVNERSEVVQGNNRAAGLKIGYNQGNSKYKNDLADNAEKFGFSKEQVLEMKNPILVREVAFSDEGAIEFGNYDAKDLETGGKGRIDPIALVKRIPIKAKAQLTALLFKDDLTLNNAIRNNEKEVLGILTPYLNTSQRTTLIKDGELSARGVQDIEAVVQQFLFDNGDMALPDLFENLSHKQKEGIRKSLPFIFSAGIDANLIPEIQNAILALNQYESSGIRLFDSWLTQADAFTDNKSPKEIYTPQEIAIARVLNDAKSQIEIVNKFKEFSVAVEGVAEKPATLLDEATPAIKGKTKEQALNEIFKIKKDEGQQEVDKRSSKKTDKKTPTKEQSPEEIAKRIRDKKNKGSLSAIDFGISVTLYNGALEFMAKQVESGTKLGNAIANTIKWIDGKMEGKKWNKGAFGKYMNDTYTMKLNDGRTVEVIRDDTKQTAQVINGWYQPIEQKVLDTKQETQPANKWAEQLRSKEDEDLWTGVREFLESKGTQSVSKKELLDFMKDNRVEIVEVVKGGDVIKKDEAKLREIESQIESMGFTLELDMGGEGNMLIDKDGEIAEYEGNEEAYGLLETYNELSDEAFNQYSRVGQSDTKYSQYQLEGEKSNYKEVLVTLPSKVAPADNPNVVITKDFKAPNGDVHFKVTDKSTGNVYKHIGNEGSTPQSVRHQVLIKFDLQAQQRVGQDFKSSHFDEPNILVHLRMNTRTDADGNKVLFLEEVQSDWGQKGKKEGFKEDASQKEKDDLTFAIKRTVEEQNKNEKGSYNYNRLEETANNLRKRLRDLQDKESKTPTAPFVMDTNAWTKLGLKVALKEAVKQGADKIAWTTGEQQNERYDLSKQVDKILAVKEGDNQYRISGKKNNQVVIDKLLKENELEANIGKELANKIINGEGFISDPNGNKTNVQVFEGDGLKVGGKGMKGFYGSPTEGSLGIVGNVAKSLFKQEPKTVDIDIDKPLTKTLATTKGDDGKYYVFEGDNYNEPLSPKFDTQKEAAEYLPKVRKQKTSTIQHSIDITPELKASVEGGLPLFGTNLTERQQLEEKQRELDNKIAEEKKKLDDLNKKGENLGFAFDPKAEAERQYNIHKTLVSIAKLYIQKGVTTAQQFANEVGLRLQDVSRAFEEALGKKTYSKDDITNSPYDTDYIRLAWQPTLPQQQNQIEIDANDAIANGAISFVDFNNAMSANAAYNSLPNSSKQIIYNNAVATYSNTQAINQANQNNQPNPTINLKEQTWLEKVKTVFQDRLTRLKDIQKQMELAGIQILDQANVALKYELLIGKSKAKIDEKYQQIVKSNNKNKPALFERLVKEGGDVDELGIYMYALHAQERNAAEAQKRQDEFNQAIIELTDKINNATTQSVKTRFQNELTALVQGKGKVKLLPDGGSGMTNQQANDIIDAVNQSGKKSLYDRYAQDFRNEVINPALDQQLQYGLISQESYDLIKAKYQNYVPLQVVEKALEKRIGGGTGAGNVRGKDIYKSKGSDLYKYTDRYNPVVSSLFNYNNAIIRGEQNLVNKTLIELANLDTQKEVFEIHKPKYTPIVDANGDVKYLIPMLSDAIKNNSVETKVDGKPVFVEIKDKALLDAIKQNGAVRGIRGLHIINTWLRNTATIMNPEFIFTNFSKDYETGLFNIQSVMVDNNIKGLTRKIANPKNIFNAGRGILEDYKGNHNSVWAKAVKEYKDNGGQVSWFQKETLDEYVNDIENKIKSIKKGEIIPIKVLNNLGETLFLTQSVVEQSIRVTTFKILRDAGVSAEKAASAAKNITVNFETKGTWSGLIDSLYLFSTASIQGSYRMAKSLATSKKAQGAAAFLFTVGIFEAYLNDIFGGEDDDDEQISDKVKERNFVLVNPENSKDIYFKFPLAYGANVFKYAGNIVYDVANGRKTPIKGTTEILLSIYNQFSPIQGATMSQAFLPTFIDPIMQGIENKNFMATPIKPEQVKYQPAKKESDLYFSSVRPISKDMATWLNENTGGTDIKAGYIDISPEYIDHYFDAFTGGTGRFIANVGTTTRSLVDDEQKYEIRNTPFVRSFVGEPIEKRNLQFIYNTFDRSLKDVLTDEEMKKFEKELDLAVSTGSMQRDTAKKLLKQVKKAQSQTNKDNIGETGLGEPIE
jgi:hypothetical protein